MDKQVIKAEIERRIHNIENCPFIEADFGASTKRDGKLIAYKDLLSFIDSLPEEPEEESDLQDAEVIFSGYALHTDVTKWADGYKLKIRIYDDN